MWLRMRYIRVRPRIASCANEERKTRKGERERRQHQLAPLFFYTSHQAGPRSATAMAGAAVNHILGLVLVLIDFALYLVTLGPLITLYRYLTAQTVFAKPVADADINKGGPPSKVWRSIDAIEDGKLEDGIAWFGGCHTAYEAFALAYSKFATNRAQAQPQRSHSRTCPN